MACDISPVFFIGLKNECVLILKQSPIASPPPTDQQSEPPPPILGESSILFPFYGPDSPPSPYVRPTAAFS